MAQSPYRTPAHIFERLRPRLFSIAYRMLGSVMEAEDILQEAYLRYAQVDESTVQSSEAYLSTVVTRLCLDHLKSARVQREQYVGPWLPEPLLTTDGPASTLEKSESITMAFLLLLEQLSPVERAVFLLREVFDYAYPEVAAIVEKSEANCRQIFARARQHLNQNRPRFGTPPDQQQRLLQRFLAALEDGNIDDLAEVLSEDARMWSDGGGRVTAARKPVLGRDQVVRFLTGLARLRPQTLSITVTHINGAPSLLLDVEGKLYAVWHFSFDHGEIAGIYAVLNPEKLCHLQMGR